MDLCLNSSAVDQKANKEALDRRRKVLLTVETLLKNVLLVRFLMLCRV